MCKDICSKFITVLMVMKYWYNHTVEFSAAIKNEELIYIYLHGHLSLIYSGQRADFTEASVA